MTQEDEHDIPGFDTIFGDEETPEEGRGEKIVVILPETTVNHLAELVAERVFDRLAAIIEQAKEEREAK